MYVVYPRILRLLYTDSGAVGYQFSKAMGEKGTTKAIVQKVPRSEPRKFNSALVQTCSGVPPAQWSWPKSCCAASLPRICVWCSMCVV